MNHHPLPMRPLPGVSLIVLLMACGASVEEPGKGDAAQQSAPSAAAVGIAHPIVGEWLATAVTINGMKDPDMDPTGKVKWSIRADSSLAMWDATEGTPDSMNGKWRLDEGKIFRMIDPENKEVTSFEVKRLDKDSLRMKVLEETEAEVLLFFTRN
jgi:hypothetical protein